MQELIDQERSAGSSDPTEELASWSERLGELEDTRKLALTKMDAIVARKGRIEDLEKDRDTLLEEMSAGVPAALDALTSEEKNRVYRMLRLSAAPRPYGYEVSGAICAPEPSCW